MAVLDRGTALQGFFAHYDGTGNSEATLAERITTKCVLDYELVQLVHNHGGRPLRGLPIGKLPELWPFDLLKDPLLAQAREFVRQVKTHNWEAVENVYAFQVWGPYSEKVSDSPQEWTPEEGNPLIPKHQQRKALRVQGYQGNELDWRKGCAFLIRGLFTRAAKHGHMDEETGVLLI